MKIIDNNCEHCPDFNNNTCNGNSNNCMCKKCPRNLGKCLVTRYCTETESVLDY